MKYLGVLIIICLMIFCIFVKPTLASGFIDEMLYSSEWWPEEDQHGDFEINNFGLYNETEGFDASSIYNFSWHQVLSSGNSVNLNCFSLSREDDAFQIFNFTWKTGSPDGYIAFGAAVNTFFTLPHINIGKKFPLADNVKAVLDADFYSLILANYGKVEGGLEFNLTDNVQLYGNISQPFLFGGTNVEVIDTTNYELQAKLDFGTLYLDANLYSTFGASESFVVAEFGIKLSSLALIGRVGSVGNGIDDAGIYSIGINYKY